MSADDDTVGKPPRRLFLAVAGDLVAAVGATGVLTTPAWPAASSPETDRADTAPLWRHDHADGAQMRFAAFDLAALGGAMNS